MAPDCPWSGYEPATIHFCEERLCAYVVEPSNTWSNLAYIAVGLWILWLSRDALRNYLASIGLTAILVGIGSFAFHATGTWWGEYLDVSAMYLISGQFVTFGIKRLLRWKDSQLLLFYAAFAGLSMLFLWNFPKLGIPLFVVHVIMAGAIEVRIFRRRIQRVDYTHLRALIGAFAVAFTFWSLDVTGLLCQPHNHLLSGHAVWHLSNSLCLYFFYRYNLQFERTPVALAVAGS